jgi:hypothetical protein
MSELTAKQVEAFWLLSDDKYKHYMLYGGSRSGKSFVISNSMIVRAVKEQSRHVCFRHHFNHIKTSLWDDTFPRVLKTCFDGLKYDQNKSDFFIEFINGSQIWFAGLDDKDRTEKILGTEYSTLYFNETSQISYKSVETALTRLSEKNSLRKVAYYDCNPPSIRHWSYKLFMEGLDPLSDKPLTNKQVYASMKMNPQDNVQNLSDDYIRDFLENLSGRSRQRFLLGEFGNEDIKTWILNFEPAKHVSELAVHKYNMPLMFSFDFNKNPFACIIGHQWNDAMGLHTHFFKEIVLFDADIYGMASKIKSLFTPVQIDNAIFTGDATGRNTSVLARNNMTAWSLLMQELRIASKRLHTPKSNPSVKDNRFLVEHIFARHNDLKIHPSLKTLIYEIENTEADDDGNILKKDRENEAQRADLIDCLRYFFNTWTKQYFNYKAA